MEWERARQSRSRRREEEEEEGGDTPGIRQGRDS